METEEKESDSGAQDYFVNSDGKRIFCKYWYPQAGGNDQLRAIVLLCHGAGEHCQAYEKVAAALAKEGILAFAHDHVGHGKSEGDRVHIDTFDTFVLDVMQHLDIVKKKHPELPCYVVGHSMGGTIAVKTALDHPDAFAGVVLIGPAISLNRETVSPFKVKHYVEDPLVWHGGLKARFSVNLLGAMDEIGRRVSEIKWPFFILHGSADKICTVEGSQMLVDKAGSKVKSLKVFEGAYHQVHKEPDGQGEEAISDIVDWITRV